MPDGQRTALPGADHQIVLAGKDDGEGKSPLQMRQRLLGCLNGRAARKHLVGNQVDHDFGVGLGLELVALGGELLPELGKVLDDAVVHDRDAGGHVRMGVDLSGTPVRRPARVPDAHMALQRLLGKTLLQIFELAFGAAAVEGSVFNRSDACGIIAAIFEPAQGFDQIAGDRLAAQNSNDAAHGRLPTVLCTVNGT